MMGVLRSGIGKVVPTPVGVNRIVSTSILVLVRCPHTRGGEPGCRHQACGLVEVVPTPVGVNRDCRTQRGREFRCPHTRGGEPIVATTQRTSVELSPHPWG